MNKAELIEAIAKQTGLSKTDTKKVLEAGMKVVTKTLKKGDRVALVGFGTFHIHKRKARKGINPSTKEEIKIPAKKIAKFRIGKDLAAAVAK